MIKRFNRRDFLKFSGTALAAGFFLPSLPPFDAFLPYPLVRVTSNGLEDKGIPIYKEPNDTSEIKRVVYRDEILNLYEEVDSGTPEYNPVWYKVWGGYLHRARTQKVLPYLNQPSSTIRENGQLAEVTVPYTQAMYKVLEEWRLVNRLYFESVHWVVGVETGPDGLPWYVILDELIDQTYIAPAHHFRLIPDDEITPLSTNVPWEQKYIYVDLTRQRMVCYENNVEVFSSLISSGRMDPNPGKNGIPTQTPAGKFNITVKFPSKHMGGGDLAAAADVDAYQLPGVPWTSFIKFTDRPFQGHAFHGTYWHDNYGVPMSSGCINMRTAEAKWLFRWVYPTSGADEIDPLTLDKRGYGTPGEMVNS